MSSGSQVSSFFCSRTSIALTHPAFSKALFHSAIPSMIGRRNLKGIVFSIQNTIRSFGGVGPSPAIDISHKLIPIALLREVLDRRHEVPDPVIGQTRLISVGRHFADRVVHVN